MDKIARLHRGNRSEVYHVVDSASGQSVIWKVPVSGHPGEQRLLNEYEVCSKLNFTGVRRPIERGVFQQAESFSYAHIFGQPLRKIVPANGISPDRFFSLALKIVAILEKVHEEISGHYYLNWGNVLFNSESQTVHLIDFSLAGSPTLVAQEISELFSEDLVFFAPECFRSRQPKIDKRADLYSLGVLFYYLLTGQLPHAFTDPSSLINDILTRPAEFENSALPKHLENLVLKLLSVDVKNRYQNCFSLWHDLNNLKKMHDENIIDEAYALGAFDEVGEIQISQRLYGKQEVLQEMFSNFDQTRSLGIPVFILHGKTGVGKGKLVTEFANYLDDLQIYFTETRCESFGHNHQNPLVKCLLDLGQLIMARSASELVIWETLIDELYNDLGAPLFKILPTFRVSDKWNEVDPVGKELGDFQLEGVINKVLQRISDASIPLVLSLKSFQNIAPSVKSTIINLIRSGQVRDVSFILSVDDDEMLGDKQADFFSELENIGAHLFHIEVKEWTKEDVNDYVSDSLNSREVTSISGLIYDKTLGHPFFVNRLLDNIKENQLAVYNQRTSEWQVDWDALNEIPVGQHLVDFQLSAIEEYDSAHIELLKYLSCIGLQFDRATITQLTYLTGPTLGAMLKRLEGDYIIVPTSNKDYKWNSEVIKSKVYSKIDDSEKSDIHLKVALYLDQQKDEDPSGNLILRKAYHFERVLEGHRVGYEEKIKQTFLQAAQSAEEMASFELAFKYYKHLINLLDDSDWNRDYVHTKSQFEKATKMALVNNEVAYGDTWMNIILTNSKDVLDAIYAYELKLNYLTEKHDFVAAVSLLLDVLKKLGHTIKRDPSQVAIMSELARTLWTLKNKKIKDLVDLPQMTDPSAYAFLKLTVKGATSIFGTAPDILPIVFFRQVRFSVVHGNCEYSPFAYISFGFAISVFMDQLKKGYEFGKMALELTDKLGAEEVKNRVLVTFYGFLSYWQDDLSLSLKPLRSAYQLGLQKGDFLYSSFALSFESTIRLVCGHNLEHLLEAKNDSIQEVRNLNQDLLEIIMEIERQFVLNLTTEKEDVLAFDLEGFNEDAIIESLEKLGDTASTFDLYAWRLFLACTFGLFDKAYDYVSAAESFSEETTSRQITYPTFLVMSCLAGYEKLDLDVKRSASKKIKRALRKKEKIMALFAKNAPQNFQCMHEFIQGCRAAHEGRKKDSESLILSAITLAGKGRFIHLESIFRDHLSRLYSKWGNHELAEYMFTKATESYQKWGATAKVSQMLTQKQASSATHLFSSSQSPPAIQDIHDFNTILSANKSLSDTGSLVELLDVMIDIIRKNNSATGAIVMLKLPQQNNILPVAQFVDGKKTIFDGSKPLDTAVPERITRFVWRTKQSVNAYDIGTHKHYRTDSYVVQNKPKAVLCIPVIVKGRAEGVIYMDNDIEAGVFDTKKIEFFDTIVSQFQVSYDNLMVHGRLEELVKERTQKLELVNKQMQSAKEESDRLLLNILPQETADELRRFGQTTAKRFDHVSVLFCDIVDFTKLSENLSPEDLVADLDLYFKAFDEMSMRNGLEKIKTVGDAYLSAGGIPENNTATAVDVINTAIEMQAFVKDLEAKRREESRSFYQIRIGVHSGPVVAGVVGLRKFQFDIWGDTVNIAARMQQSSEPGKINISKVTYDLVKDHFNCTSRGEMIAKNKGQMEMFYVDAKMSKS